MANADINGRRILTIVTNYGVEQDELVVPVERLRGNGAEVTIAAATNDSIKTLMGDKEPGTTVQPTTTLSEVNAGDYDLLLVPGGTQNADTLRLDEDAVRIVERFASSGRPIASICHGPWALVEADVVRGKTLTSYPSLKTDIRNAGAESWVDQSVVSDSNGGYLLVTSRNPGDLDDFVGATEKALSS